MKTDREWRTFLRGYFLDINPHATKDEWTRELWDIFWEVMACIGVIAFFVWLAYLPHLRG